VNVPFLHVGDSYQECKTEFDSAFYRVMDSGLYLFGDELTQFEAEFASYCGTTECVAVGSGLDAIAFSLRAFGIGNGDEVLVPSQTFIATWYGVTQSGARPVPVDISVKDGQIDVEQLEKSVSPATRGIMPVHLFGIPADMVTINQFAAAQNLTVIEDAAQAHGASIDNARCGSWGDAAAFSFYPGKNLGAFGDGGCITTNDASIAQRVRSLRNYGSLEKHRHDELGFNSRLDELQAAFLRVKLRRLDEWNSRRVQQAQRYESRLQGVAEMTTFKPRKQTSPVWHVYPILTTKRDLLKEHLEVNGVQTQIHYPCPPPFSKAYQHRNFYSDDFPVASTVCQQTLSLPIGPHFTAAQTDRVCDLILEFFSSV